jgi:hypothetical protein
MAESHGIEPDAEILDTQQSKRLLELAGYHVREALQFPDELQTLRTILANTMLEVAMQRQELDYLRKRIEVLERRVTKRDRKS